MCVRAELRRSKLISAPSNFSHIGHIGPEEKVNIVQDRFGCFCVFLLNFIIIFIYVCKFLIFSHEFTIYVMFFVISKI